MDILEKIINTKKEELKEFTDDYISIIERMAEEREKIYPFSEAFSQKGINIIAEIKKASPSKGVIRQDFNPVEIAKIYQENGAKAISVLTDIKYFQGNLEYLKEVREVVNLPLLRKDFIIDERQILEARAWGADAFLLIARVLTESQIKRFIEFGEELELEALVEIHSLDEGKKAINAGAKIVGINNRDLSTFNVDINLSKQLAPKLKEMGASIVISESGINTKEQILELLNYQIDGFLIGESLMREKDIGKKLRELIS